MAIRLISGNVFLAKRMVDIMRTISPPYVIALTAAGTNIGWLSISMVIPQRVIANPIVLSITATALLFITPPHDPIPIDNIAFQGTRF